MKFIKLSLQVILVLILALSCYHQIPISENVFIQSLIFIFILGISFIDVSIAILCTCIFIISLMQLKKLSPITAE